MTYSVLNIDIHEYDYYALTFDIDWAPDWCVETCLDICRKASIPATIFVTHKSKLIDEINNDPLFELGIHPNFFPGSSHGNENRDILDYCLDIVPAATSFRTHGLYMSSPLLSLISDEYETLRTDVSIFMPFNIHLRPTSVYMGEKNRRIVRIPYFWEDDAAASCPGWNWKIEIMPSSGLKIFNFHPIHVALNMASLKKYSELKNKIHPKKLYELNLGECETYINLHDGVRTYLQRIVDSLPKDNFKKISELAEIHEEKILCE